MRVPSLCENSCCFIPIYWVYKSFVQTFKNLKPVLKKWNRGIQRNGKTSDNTHLALPWLFLSRSRSLNMTKSRYLGKKLTQIRMQFPSKPQQHC